MKIAVIGSGIAGNVAAYHLRGEHDITVFEAASHIGGHTHTHDIEHEDETVPDPYYGGPQGFEHVLDLLEDGCEGLLAEIMATSARA